MNRQFDGWLTRLTGRIIERTLNTDVPHTHSQRRGQPARLRLG